jgi:ABC-type multidrug transport system fused ATPase/permease subunit
VSDIQGEGKTRPLISYAATDATSGVDHYELSMDGGAYKRVDFPSFRPDSITTGTHTFSVKAFDKAGNVKEKSIKVKIKQIQTPVIKVPKSETYFKIGQSIKVSGTGEPGTLLTLYIDGNKIAENIKISSDGTWNYEYKGILLNGSHYITAKSVSDGIESQLSKKTRIKIDASAVSLGGIVIPSFVLIIVVLVIIFLLLLLLVYLYRKIQKLRAAYRKKREETEDVINKNLKIMEADMEKKIEHELEAKHDAGSVWKTEKNVEKELEEEIEETKQRIRKDLEKEEGEKPKK